MDSNLSRLSQHDQNRIRVIVANFVLTHKPEGASLSSFMILLRSQLPSLPPEQQQAATSHTAIQANYGIGCEWFKKIQDVETRLAKTTLDLEQSRLELSNRRARYPSPSSTFPASERAPGSSQAPESSMSVNQGETSNPLAKKKRKPGKAAPTSAAGPPCKTIDEAANIKINDLFIGTKAPPALSDSLQMLGSLRAFLAVRHESDPPASQCRASNLDEICATSVRLLRSVGSVTSAAMAISHQQEDARSVANPARKPGTLLRAVSQVLQIGIPFIPVGIPPNQQEQLMDIVSSSIIRPLLGGFLAESRALYVRVLLKRPPIQAAKSSKIKGPTPSRPPGPSNGCGDLRKDALKVLASLLDNSSTNALLVQNFAESISFLAVQELQAIVTEPQPFTQDKEVIRERHVLRLASKDALWYLCNILHRSLPLLPRDASQPTILIADLRRKMADFLADIMNGAARQEGCRGLDEVEKGMVLGVAEQLWMSDLDDGHMSDL